MKANSDTYNYVYHDYIDARCILTNVRLAKIKANKYRLPQSEKERAEVILWASIAADKRGHSAPPTCHRNRDEAEAEIINLQTTLAKEVSAEGVTESKERSPREDSFRNTTPVRETRGACTENMFDQSAQAGTTSPADKRYRMGETGAMNMTPLSAIQEVLLNKKEGKKSKFTVELEEREENGKSRVRIDIYGRPMRRPRKLTERSYSRFTHRQGTPPPPRAR